MTDKRKLEMRIRGRNLANRIGNEIYPMLREVIEPLVGENIRKQTGGLFKKYETPIKEVEARFPSHPKLQMIHMNGLEYNISWHVKCCETFCEDGKDYGVAIYSEATVYVANIRDGIVTELCPAPEFKDDYDVDTVIAARQAFKEAEEAYNEARSALHPFGERD